jgi:AcrR family transcriptional regulator
MKKYSTKERGLRAVPRTAAAYQELKDARRETLLGAARKVFARNGLAATRIGDITAEAGVSQGLFYHYFPTKESLFATIVEAALRETAALTAATRRSPGSAWERLQRLCAQMLAGVVAYPDYPLVIVQAFTSAAVPKEAKVAIDEYGRQTFQDIVSLIREGQAEGTVAAGDPVELTVAFNSCIQGVALSRLQAATPDALLPSAETILRLLRA